MNRIIEKRVYNRFKVNFPFEIVGDDFSFKTEMKDISLNGLFCHSREYLAPHTELKVVMNLPLCIDQRIEKKLFTCLGKVVRVEPDMPTKDSEYDLGISFGDISQAEKDLIMRFVRQKNIKEAQELRGMYDELKATIAKLVALEESHPTAEHFCNVLTEAITELDDVAGVLDKEINQIQGAVK